MRRGFHFYERQEAGLGTYFLGSLYSDIDSLRLFAGIHSVHFEKFYRLLSKWFPFAVYYEVKENTVFVRAVLDLRRNLHGSPKKSESETIPAEFRDRRSG